MASENYPNAPVTDFRVPAEQSSLVPIACPVEDCPFDHRTSQGLAGHVGNLEDGRHGWDAIDVRPAGLHELHTRGTHPDDSVRALLAGTGAHRREAAAYAAVEAVRQWTADQGLPVDSLQVYVHPAYGTVQIQPREYLGSETFTDYRAVMEACDGIRYHPDTERNSCRNEWVRNLPAFTEPKTS